MGPYLGYLGANAFGIGLIFGIGEFLGYFLRILAGFFIDKTKKYWTFVFIGYCSIISIPLLAFADYWILAGTLILIERIGKALRSPAKDTLLSIYSKDIGKGLTFGIHETADQIGAVIGPVIFYILLAVGFGYKNSFLILFIPFLAMLVFLFVSKAYSNKIQVDVKDEKLNNAKDGKLLIYLYLIFIFLTSLGFIGFPIISFHAVKINLIPEVFVPLAYSVVMVLDALVAVPIGLLYDRLGVVIMGVLPLLILLIFVFCFSGNFVLFVVALVIWGIVMSAYETIVRAHIGNVVSLSERGLFYGIFNTVLGIGFAIGNSLVGYLYDVNRNLIIYFLLTVEILAVILILPIANLSKSKVRS
ncbi:MAG: MFS transporter [Brevinematia bacterium]